MDAIDFYLRRARFGVGPATARSMFPPVLSPTMTRVSGPDDALEQLAEAELAKTPRERRMAARRRTQQAESILFGDDNQPTIGGKACCFALAKKLSLNIERLVIPSQHTCSCGTVWEMAYKVRREVLRG